MTTSAIPLLFVHYGDDWIRGSERVLLDVLANLDRQRYRPFLWCNAPALAEGAAKLDVQVHRTEFSALFAYLPGRWSIGDLFRQVRECRRLIRQHGFRLAHVNSAAPAQWMAPACRLERLPWLVHLHSHYSSRVRHALLLHQADALVGVSRATLEGFAEDGVEPERLHLVANGVDGARLMRLAKAQVPARPRSFTIVSIGSLIWRKGHDITLQALRLLTDRGLQANLVIVGSGPEEQALRAQADALGVGQRVSWMGECAGGAAYLRDVADALVVASRDEVFGLTLLEAGVFGVPCVATAVGGIPEIVEHDDTALLVPPENPQAVASAIAHLMQNGELRRRLGARLHEHVTAHHTVEHVGRQLDSLYRALLIQNAPGRIGRLLPRCAPSYLRYAGQVLLQKTSRARSAPAS